MTPNRTPRGPLYARVSAERSESGPQGTETPYGPQTGAQDVDEGSGL